jgi:transcriptional regulator with XRE-family HTH domain
MNPLFELRDRIKLSRVEFGKLVRKSKATIEKYESEISPSFAKQLADVAMEYGHPDLARAFRIAAGREKTCDSVDLGLLFPDEAEFLKQCLAIYRKPATDYERSVVVIVRELIKLKAQPSSVSKKALRRPARTSDGALNRTRG